MADFLFDEGKNKIEGLNKTAINEALTSKADAQAVATAFQSVNTALDGKASTQALNAAVQGINTALESKANTNAVNQALEEKADKEVVTRDSVRTTLIDGMNYPRFDVQGSYNVTYQGGISHRDSDYFITNNIEYVMKKGGYVTLNSFDVFKITLFFWDGSTWAINNVSFSNRVDFDKDGSLWVCISKVNGTEITPEEFNAVCTLYTNNGKIDTNTKDIISLQTTENSFNELVKKVSINMFDIAKITGGMNTTYTTPNNSVVLIENGVEVKEGNYSKGITLKGSEITLKAGTYTISATAEKAKETGNKEAIIGVVYKGTGTKLASTIELADYETPERIHHTFTLTGEQTIVVTLQCRGNASDYNDCKMQFTEIMIVSGTNYTDYVAYGFDHYVNEVNTIVAERFDIPKYWDNEIADTIAKVKANRLIIGRRIAEFIFITDTHWIDNQKHSQAIIEYLTEKLEIPLVIFGGDCVTAHHDTKQGALDELTAFFTAFTYNKNFHLLSTEGNHDDNSNNNTVGILTNDELYSFFKKRVEEFGDTSPDMDVEGRIAVVDNKSQKIRYIVWNKAINSSTGLMNKVATLVNALDSDWSVVLIAHNYWWDLDENNNPRPSDNSETVRATLETIKANSNAKIVYWQVGHLHADYSVTTDGNLLIVATMCDTSASREMNVLSPTMTIGTPTEQAFDVVQIDLANNSIYMTRCGVGNDRTFNYT